MESGNNSDDNAGGLRAASGNTSGILKIYLDLLRGKPQLQKRDTIVNIARTCKVPVDVVYKELGIEGGDVETSGVVGATNEVYGGANDMVVNESSQRHGTKRRAPAKRASKKFYDSEDSDNDTNEVVPVANSDSDDTFNDDTAKKVKSDLVKTRSLPKRNAARKSFTQVYGNDDGAEGNGNAIDTVIAKEIKEVMQTDYSEPEQSNVAVAKKGKASKKKKSSKKKSPTKKVAKKTPTRSNSNDNEPDENEANVINNTERAIRASTSRKRTHVPEISRRSSATSDSNVKASKSSKSRSRVSHSAAKKRKLSRTSSVKSSEDGGTGDFKVAKSKRVRTQKKRKSSKRNSYDNKTSEDNTSQSNEEKILRLQLYMPCRICMNNTPDTSDIFKAIWWSSEKIPISEMVMKYSNIKLSPNDRRPLLICETCLDNLKVAEKFTFSCDEIERSFSKSLAANEVQNDINVEHSVESTTETPLEDNSKGICDEIEVEENLDIKSNETDFNNLKADFSVSSSQSVSNGEPVAENKVSDSLSVNCNDMSETNDHNLESDESKQLNGLEKSSNDLGQDNVTSSMENSFESSHNSTLKCNDLDHSLVPDDATEDNMFSHLTGFETGSNVPGPRNEDNGIDEHATKEIEEHVTEEQEIKEHVTEESIIKEHVTEQETEEQETVDNVEAQEDIHNVEKQENNHNEVEQKAVDYEEQQENKDIEEEQEAVDNEVQEENKDIGEEQEAVDNEGEHENKDNEEEHEVQEEQEALDNVEEGEAIHNEEEQENNHIEQEHEAVDNEEEQDNVDNEEQHEAAIDNEEQQENIYNEEEQEAAVDNEEEQEAAVDNEEEQESIDNEEQQEAAIDNEDEQENIDSEEQQEAAVGNEEEQEAVDNEEELEAAVDNEEQQENMEIDEGLENIDSEEELEAAVDNEQQQENMEIEEEHEAVDNEEEQENIDNEEEQETVDNEEEQENMYNEEQTAVDNEDEQEIEDHGTEELEAKEQKL